MRVHMPCQIKDPRGLMGIRRWTTLTLFLYLIFQHFFRHDEVFGRSDLYPFVGKNGLERNTELTRRGDDRLGKPELKTARVFRDHGAREKTRIEYIEIGARDPGLSPNFILAITFYDARDMSSRVELDASRPMHLGKPLYQERPHLGLSDTLRNIFSRIDIVAHHDEKTVVQDGLRAPQSSGGAVHILLLDVEYSFIVPAATEMVPDNVSEIPDDKNDFIYLVGKRVEFVFKKRSFVDGEHGLGNCHRELVHARAAPRREYD